jgi:pyruvate-ferredoxin/flavodoxin oxidoreductase
MADTKDSDLTMSSIASRLESMKGSEPIDQEWLKEMTHPAAG